MKWVFVGVGSILLAGNLAAVILHPEDCWLNAVGAGMMAFMVSYELVEWMYE